MLSLQLAATTCWKKSMPGSLEAGVVVWGPTLPRLREIQFSFLFVLQINPYTSWKMPAPPLVPFPKQPDLPTT